MRPKLCAARVMRAQPVDWKYLSRMCIVSLATSSVAWAADSPQPASRCFGTTSKGRIEDAVKLPVDGKNFRAYSQLASTLGRTYVHSSVRNVVLASYAELAVTLPNTIFVYGETGLKSGGRFSPHRTHQNGLSVDFMVPVRDKLRRSVPLPGSLANRFGYDIEFDAAGKFGDYTIDFEAITAHLIALHRAAAVANIRIGQVIIDPAFHPALFGTQDGSFLRANLKFMQKQAWVRHDDHYHVDFVVPCG